MENSCFLEIRRGDRRIKPLYAAAASLRAIFRAAVNFMAAQNSLLTQKLKLNRFPHLVQNASSKGRLVLRQEAAIVVVRDGVGARLDR